MTLLEEKEEQAKRDCGNCANRGDAEKCALAMGCAMSENIKVLVSGLNLRSILENGEYTRVLLAAEITFVKLVQPVNMDFDAIRDGLGETFRLAVTFAPRDTVSAGRRDETNQKEKNQTGE